MQTWVRQGIKEDIVQKRYLASLIIIDDCDEAVERYVFKLSYPNSDRVTVDTCSTGKQ